MIWAVLYLAVGLAFMVLVVLLVMLLAEPIDPDRPYDWKLDGDR